VWVPAANETCCGEGPQGSFANYSQPDFETHQCDLCPPGTAAPNPYEDACTACPVGTFSEGGNCEPCRPGTYSNTTQTSQCMLCPLGQQQPDEGKSSCEPCRPGFYRGEGDTTCQPCGEDEYNPYSGQAACLKCPPNTVSKFRSAVEYAPALCAAASATQPAVASHATEMAIRGAGRLRAWPTVGHRRHTHRGGGSRTLAAGSLPLTPAATLPAAVKSRIWGARQLPFSWGLFGAVWQGCGSAPSPRPDAHAPKDSTWCVVWTHSPHG
jgi:hypothetical protein